MDLQVDGGPCAQLRSTHAELFSRAHAAPSRRRSCGQSLWGVLLSALLGILHMSQQHGRLSMSLGFREAPFEKLNFGKLDFRAGSCILKLLGFEAWKLQNEASQKCFWEARFLMPGQEASKWSFQNELLK